MPQGKPTTDNSKQARAASMVVWAFFWNTVFLSLTAVLIGLFIHHRDQIQEEEQLDALLMDRATALQNTAPALSAPSKYYNSPVYFHQGALNEAQQTAHWGVNCSRPAGATEGVILTFNCHNQQQVRAITVIHKPSEDAPNQQIVLWVVDQDDNYWNALSAKDVIAPLFLILLLSAASTQLFNVLFVTPLRNITGKAQQLLNSSAVAQLPSSFTREINALSRLVEEFAKSQQQKEHHFRRTAFKDPLTGADNRAFLMLALSERTAKAKEPLSLLTWSIDNFESISDVMGHDVAEQTLIRMTRRAKRLFKNNLVIARLESSVFCALLPKAELDLILSKHTTNRLFQTLIRVEGYQIDIQCHAGVVHYPENGQCPNALVRRVELARQLARSTRQPLLAYDNKLERRSANRLEMIGQLRSAIASDEFSLYFQPKLNVRTHQITQAEVLLRWNHPRFGLVSPGAFIELAEQTGFIKEITRMVLSKAYKIVELCAHQNIRLSLNLSTLDLEDDQLLKFIETLNLNQPEASKHLVLEITESAAMRDPEQALRVLNALSFMGFQIAIDDFGTGYSSLAYLKRFPVTELKIDRSLVQGADRDTDSQIILESTIEMGHVMGLLVTTEGIETESEYELVKKLGCDYIQGFWLAHPMPYEEFRLKHLVGNHTDLPKSAETQIQPGISSAHS